MDDLLKEIRNLIRVNIPESGLCKGRMVLWGGGIGHEIALCVASNSYEEAVLNSLWGLLKEEAGRVTLTTAAWNWNTGTPHDRAEMVRRHANGSQVSRQNLLTLFQLTENGLDQILQGTDWCPEYETK